MIEESADVAGIQPHGLLFALLGGDLLVDQVSANASRLIGREPRELLGTRFLDLVEPSDREVVAVALCEAWQADADSFRVTVRPQGGVGAAMTFEAIAHLLPGGITVVEMERDPAPREGVSPSPGSDSSLRLVCRSLAAVADLERPGEVVRVLAREIQRFTGFDRVMVERLDEDGCGEIVVDEHVDGIESLLGLHVRASTLPVASRERFLAGRFRYFLDAAASPVSLVPSISRRSGAPLDLSRAVLRSPSSIQVRHLAALEVRAGLTLPLVIDENLWGLVVCLNRRRKYVSHEQRRSVSLCALVISAQLAVKQRAQEDRRAAAARERALRLVAGLKGEYGFIEGLHAALPDFVSLFSADGASVLSGAGGKREIRSSGSVPPDLVLTSLRDELNRKTSDGPMITDRAMKTFSSLAGCLPRAAGMVAIPLGEESWVLAFRDEAVRLRRWARDLSMPGNAGREDIVRGLSAPWSSTTSTLVTELRSGILDLARHHAAGLERANQDLRLFAGVVAHEVKNQVQPGVLALSMLRSGQGISLSPAFSQVAEVGERTLSGLVKFSTEMLEFAEAEMSSLIEEIDLGAVVEQVVRQLRIGQVENGVSFEISALTRIRELRIQMHHVLANLVRNALHHRRSGSRPLHVHVGSLNDPEHGPVVFVRDDGRGIDEEDQQRMFDYLARGGESSMPGLGIGLDYCAQVIQRLIRRFRTRRGFAFSPIRRIGSGKCDKHGACGSGRGRGHHHF